MANVNITIHRVPVNRLLYAPGGDVHDLVDRTTTIVEAETIAEAPIMTGAMVNSIRKEIDIRPGRAVVGRVLSNDEAALWVNQGTGIFGPQRTRITPRTSRFLRWPDRRGGSGFVYRRSVAGQPPNDFFWRGLSRGTALSLQEWTLVRYIE